MKKFKIVLIVLVALLFYHEVKTVEEAKAEKTYNVSQTYDNISSNIDAGIDNLDAAEVKAKYDKAGDSVLYVLDDIGDKTARLIYKFINVQ